MSAPLCIGRYMVCDQIGAGGTATVHLGRLMGAAGFSRVVAIKRLDPSRAESEKYAAMLLDEARIASRIRHPNVNATLDVVRADGELLLVMEYVHGPSLSWLRSALAERRALTPRPIALRVMLDVLAGLHAAHNAKSEQGQPLGLVHRDVSPQNVVVGDDGIARVLDFGVAKAEGRLVFSVVGEIKGKLAYMSPEQLRGAPVDARTDVFAAGVLFAELLSGQPLFGRATAEPISDALAQRTAVEATVRARLAHVEPTLVAIVARALAPRRDDRYASADEMATALTAGASVSTHKEVAAWLGDVAGELLSRRALQIAQIEQVSAVVMSAPIDEPAPASTLAMTKSEVGLASAPAPASTLAMTKSEVGLLAATEAASTLAMAKPEVAPPAATGAANATLKLAPTPGADRTLPLNRDLVAPRPAGAPAPVFAAPSPPATPGAALLPGAQRVAPGTVLPMSERSSGGRTGVARGGRSAYVVVAAIAIVLIVTASLLAGHRSRTRDVGRVRAPDVVPATDATGPSAR